MAGCPRTLEVGKATGPLARLSALGRCHMARVVTEPRPTSGHTQARVLVQEGDITLFCIPGSRHGPSPAPRKAGRIGPELPRVKVTASE